MILLLASGCRGGGEEAWQPPPNDPAARATWFVHYVAALADRGGVDTSDQLAPVLHSGYTELKPDRRTLPLNCRDAAGHDLPYSIEQFTLLGTWFKSLPGGVTHMSYPGFTINPPGETGPATLAFERSRSACPFMRSYNTSEIHFNDLPAFACITGDKLIAAIPRIEQSYVTDGFTAFNYQGATHQLSSTSLSFSGRYGGPCLIDAVVTRRLGYGYQYRRTAWKLRNCESTAEKQFCAANPRPQSRPDLRYGVPSSAIWPLDPTTRLREWRGRMSEAAQKSCGILDSYLAREPVYGEAVEPVPWDPVAPC